MNRLKLISLCTIFSLSLLQAADPKTQSDKTGNEELALPDYITVPASLHALAQRKPEKVSLNEQDPITHLTFKEHIKCSHDKDLPWIMVAYRRLLNEKNLNCDYADAIAFIHKYVTFTGGNCREERPLKKPRSMDVTHTEPISISLTYYACTMPNKNPSQVEVRYLGSQIELGRQNSFLRALLEAVSSNEPSAAAQNVLAQYFHDSKDFKRAVKWLQRAVEKGDPNAMFDLGTFCMVRANLAREEAAKKIYLDALFAKGVLCAKLGDRVRAEQLWKAAADEGHRDAMFNLGRLCDGLVYRGMLFDNKGDKDTAGQLWRVAASNGNLHATLSLWTLYEDRAEELWRAAAHKGHVNAKLHLERMQQSQ